MRFKRVVVFLFILFISSASVSYGASIDQSLFKGNKSELLKRYQDLFSNMPKTTEFLTQRILLSVLINIVSNNNDFTRFKPKITNVKNQYDFLKLLKSVAKLELKYSDLNKKLDEIDKKLELLKENISQSRNNDKKLEIYQLQYAMYELTKEKLKKRPSFWLIISINGKNCCTSHF